MPINGAYILTSKALIKMYISDLNKTGRTNAPIDMH
jgi:hypothetical protein